VPILALQVDFFGGVDFGGVPTTTTTAATTAATRIGHRQ
jgi:hypothetical protein